APSSTVSAMLLPGPGSAVIVRAGIAVFGPVGGGGSKRGAGGTGVPPPADPLSIGSPSATAHPVNATAVPAASNVNIRRLSTTRSLLLAQTSPHGTRGWARTITSELDGNLTLCGRPGQSQVRIRGGEPTVHAAAVDPTTRAEGYGLQPIGRR